MNPAANAAAREDFQRWPKAPRSLALAASWTLWVMSTMKSPALIRSGMLITSRSGIPVGMVMLPILGEPQLPPQRDGGNPHGRPLWDSEK